MLRDAAVLAVALRDAALVQRQDLQALRAVLLDFLLQRGATAFTLPQPQSTT